MRRLSLTRETLTELTADELDVVAGGSGLSCAACISGIVKCATLDCVPTQDACFTTAGCG